MKKNIISALIIFGVTVTLLYILGSQSSTPETASGELMVEELQK